MHKFWPYLFPKDIRNLNALLSSGYDLTLISNSLAHYLKGSIKRNQAFKFCIVNEKKKVEVRYFFHIKWFSPRQNKSEKMREFLKI